MPKLLFFYSALLAVVITVSSGRFVIFFLPVFAYFILEMVHRLLYSKSTVIPGKLEKLLVYYGFIASSLIVITGFASVRSPVELVSALLFSPILIYFFIRILPTRRKALNVPLRTSAVPILNKANEKEYKEVVKLKKEGVDIDKRMFLKLIGSAGLSIFIFSLFTKKAEAAFFGSVPGPGTVSIKDSLGTKIDPAEKHPTDGYKITEIDDAGNDSYTGYIKKGGAWYIVKEIGSGTDSSYRYAKGASSFTTNWTNRASLTYDYYDNVF